MPLQWGKSNKQHRATSQRSRAFTSQYSCHRATFNDEDVGNGRRFVEVAPFVVGPRHRTPLSVWRRSTARRARRTSTPGVATPLLHATPSRPSSSSCLFSLCLQLAARISAPRGKSTIRTYARVLCVVYMLVLYRYVCICVSCVRARTWGCVNEILVWTCVAICYFIAPFPPPFFFSRVSFLPYIFLSV